MVSVAEKRLRDILNLHSIGGGGGGGGGGHSPGQLFVPLLLWGQAGLRIAKYGAKGLDRLFKYVGEAAKVEAIKEYSDLIALGTVALVAGTGAVVIPGSPSPKVSRLLVFGAAFWALTAALDKVEQAVLKAVT